ncbi:hypothetical protein BJX63DRAFT_427064 [Aspergillus granulosus]|uniref:Uncharacterized protein n=1 Tax=Aspergillus granulosus TaxID=176169 RepID=A0ABR4I413_9EURO
MRSLALPLAFALVGLAVADDEPTTMPYYQPNWDSAWDAMPSYHGTVGSVVSVSSQDVTYAISCSDDAATSTCSIKDPWTMVAGPSTYSLAGVYTAYNWRPPVTVSYDWDCKMTSYSESPSCSFSLSYTGSESGLETSLAVQISTQWDYTTGSPYGLAVTEGLDKISEAATAATAAEATTTSSDGAGMLVRPVEALITAAPVVLAAGVGALL